MILITGDILRPDPTGKPHQRGNIIRLSDWLSKYDQELLVPFYPTEMNEWVRTDEPNYPLHQNYEIIHDYKLVVGWEMPRNLITYLESINKPYIDLNDHPLRFNGMKAGIHTNIPIPLDLIYKAPAYPVAATGYKTLIIGQTAEDRSLIRNCSFAKLTDFKNKLELLKDAFYKPHPLAPNYQVNEMHKLGFDVVTDKTYDLLASGQYKKVITISSSVGYEAPYFGVESEFLFERDMVKTLIPMEWQNFYTFLNTYLGVSYVPDSLPYAVQT